MAPREARARRCSSTANNRLAAMQLRAPFAATVISVRPPAETPIPAGTAIVVLEAMKMEHELVAERDAVVRRLEVAVGDTVDEGQLLAELAEATQVGDGDGRSAPASPDGDAPDPRDARDAGDARDAHNAREARGAGERQDLEQVRRRHGLGLDA